MSDFFAKSNFFLVFSSQLFLLAAADGWMAARRPRHNKLPEVGNDTVV